MSNPISDRLADKLSELADVCSDEAMVFLFFAAVRENANGEEVLSTIFSPALSEKERAEARAALIEHLQSINV